MQHVDRARAIALSGALLAPGFLGACGDDTTTGDGGASATTTGAATASTTTTTAATSTGVAATTGGDGGQGGAGGGVGGGGEGGEGGAASFTCVDGTLCEASLCSFDPPTETWGCVAPGACQEERRCGGECCPTGSRCEEGACLAPNLSIDAPRLLASAEVTSRTFGSNACEIVEGCVDAAGRRRLLRFDLKTPNDGEGDLFLGDPDDNESLFEFSSCHDHFHFTTYAAYRLLDLEGNVAATGHKQAFCLLDFEREDGGPNAIYDCGYQGIQRGWSDIYDSYLPCQWVDITDVPAGEYQLEVRLNTDHVLFESDYEDNAATVTVTIEPDSCPDGCAPWDDEVCQPGDPQGRAGDGVCDCSGIHEWDAADCGTCGACTTISCPGGCAEASLLCCGSAADECKLGDDGVCQCPGAPWDESDCDTCFSDDADCEVVDSCPRGCGFSGDQCHGFDEDSVADGWCDCTDEGWDTIDCHSCTSSCGQD